MNRSLALLIVVLLLLAACAPAAPAPTQAPAVQPTSAPAQAAPAAQPTLGAVIPTQAPAQAIPSTPAPLATGLPELKPPVSGGVLNPPTIIPTQPGNTSVTSGQPPTATWSLYRDPVLGLTFQYPRSWQTAIGRNSKDALASI